MDTGATNHMTGGSNLFTSYMPCSGKDKVRVADGSMAPIMGRGSIYCTKSLSLSPVDKGIDNRARQLSTPEAR
jgi:hypothetical protein